MAKPTKTPMVSDREKVIGVRVSDAEHAVIEAQAEALGLKVSQYVRSVVLKEARAAQAKPRDGQ